jgi:transposase-like protein
MKAGNRSVEMQRRREYWRRILAECERSGGSVRAFCRERQVKEHLFYRWRRVLEEEAGVGRAAAAGPRFVLVKPESEAAAGADSSLELLLERGWRLRIPPGADESTVRAVLGALAAAR